MEKVRKRYEYTFAGILANMGGKDKIFASPKKLIPKH